MHDTGNSWGIIWSIRLKLSGTQSLLESHLLIHKFENCVGLVAVGYDGLVAKDTNRSVDNQAWVNQFGRVKSLCTDTCAVFYKHAIAAVFASSHNEISGYRILSVFRLTDDNASARVCILL